MELGSALLVLGELRRLGYEQSAKSRERPQCRLECVIEKYDDESSVGRVDSRAVQARA